MTRALRDRLTKIEETGLTIVNVSYGPHIRIYVEAPDGRRMFFVVSRTPSDWRAGRKNTALLRRFARAQPSAAGSFSVPPGTGGERGMTKRPPVAVG